MSGCIFVRRNGGRAYYEIPFPKSYASLIETIRSKMEVPKDFKLLLESLNAVITRVDVIHGGALVAVCGSREKLVQLCVSCQSSRKAFRRGPYGVDFPCDSCGMTFMECVWAQSPRGIAAVRSFDGEKNPTRSVDGSRASRKRSEETDEMHAPLLELMIN